MVAERHHQETLHPRIEVSKASTPTVIAKSVFDDRMNLSGNPQCRMSRWGEGSFI
jgi:hypothetical protein